MSAIRFYADSITKPVTEIIGAEAHHLASVRRLGTGDSVEIFDGKGGLATAKIEKAGSAKVRLIIEDLKILPKPDCGRIIIAVSIAKGERFDWLIGKCTELGVDRIMPVVFQYTVKRPENPKIVERWKNIAISSSKQCGRLFLPDIDVPMELSDAIEVVKKEYQNAKIVYGGFEVDAKYVIGGEFKGDIAAFIGPEGGFTDKEQQILKDCGAEAVRLTNTILRVETAALTFASILCTLRDSVKK